MRPTFHVLFRPEQIHAASGFTPCCLAFQYLRKSYIQVSHGCRWIDFQDFLITHTNDDGFATVQTPSVNTNLSAGKEPAHGQRFQSSLTVPLLLPVDG